MRELVDQPMICRETEAFFHLKVGEVHCSVLVKNTRCFYFCQLKNRRSFQYSKNQ
jgi:hypothetical protein